MKRKSYRGDRQSASYCRELDSLLHVSHAVGSNALYVQAGGGNTSVKFADGSMVIKASGTPLQGMTHDKGWVMVDMGKIRSLFGRADLGRMSAAEREKEVLTVLYGSVIRPADARPSVETPLHTLLNRVVIHTHPVAATALICHPQGEKILRRICRDDAEQPVWLAYTDPGATLAFAVAERVARYRAAHGRIPRVIFQQNHGLFVSDDNPTACIHLHNQILRRVETYFAEHQEPAVDAKAKAVVEDGIRAALADSGKKPLIRFSKRNELTMAARSDLRSALADALSPDHVVYMGPCALFLPRSPSAAAVARAVASYRKKWHIAPKVVVIEGKGVCLVGETESKCDASEALACSAVQAAMLNGNRLRFLSPKSTHFIMNWEAEHYRAKQN